MKKFPVLFISWLALLLISVIIIYVVISNFEEKIYFATSSFKFSQHHPYNVIPDSGEINITYFDLKIPYILHGSQMPCDGYQSLIAALYRSATAFYGINRNRVLIQMKKNELCP